MSDGDGTGAEDRRLSVSLGRLAALLRNEGGLMRSLIPGEAPPGADTPSGDGAPHAGAAAEPRTGAGQDLAGEATGVHAAGPAQIVAAGPRAAASAVEYELLVETIYEGYLLHYGAPRLLRPPDADLALLAGDRLYALGLARLVAHGDLHAVAELADVITLTALAHGAERVELADAVWEAGARAVGWGPSEEHAQAKALVRAGAAEALEAMRAAALAAAGVAR